MEDMCRSGQFSPDSRIFLPDRNEWVRAAEAGADTGLELEFGENDEDVWRDADEADDGENESLAAEYERVRASISSDSKNGAEIYVNIVEECAIFRPADGATIDDIRFPFHSF